MRIEELYLDGFGHFYQQGLGPIPEPVTVFYGPNEAGKSTLLAFIRAILFGFPPRFNAHYPPQSGGRHGGRITLSDSTGAMYAVERYAGARGGLSISAPTGPVSNADAVMRRLTGNATADLFKNVFAFSLDELQTSSSLNDSSGTIYSAGQGAPGLPALAKSLNDSKSRIYLPRGNNQEVPRLLNALRDVEGQLRSVDGNAERYGELTSRRARTDSEIPSADSEITGINSRLNEIGRLVSGWDDWVALSDCEARLRDMPRYEGFPDNPVPRLENLEEQISQAQEARDEVAERLQRATEAAEAELSGEDLLFDRDLIETIRRSRISFDDSVKDLPERQAELNSLEGELSDRLRDLGQDWDEERLQTFDASMAFRQEVDQAKGNMAERMESVRRAEQRLEQEQRLLTECQAAATEAQEKMPDKFPTLDDARLEQQRAALRTSRGRLHEYERERQNHENLLGQLSSLTAGEESTQSESRNPLFLQGFLGLGGLALIVLGVLYGGTTLLMGLIGGLVLLVAAGFLLIRDRTGAPSGNPLASSLRAQSNNAGATTESALQLLIEATQPLGITEGPTSAALETADARIEASRTELAAWREARERLDESQRRVRTQEQRVEPTARLAKDASGYDHEARREWQGWLEQRGLPQSFTPDTVIEFMGRIETTRVKLEQVRGNRQRVGAIVRDIQEFRERVAPLGERHGLALDPEDSRQLASVADELIRRLDAAQTAFADRERAREQLEQDRQALDNRERRLQSAEQVLTVLLTAGDTDDTEEFRRRARQHEERLELERQVDEYRRSLERLSGPGERLDAFRTQLASSDPAVLSEEATELAERSEQMESHRNELREERGRIDAELGQLTGEDESSALRIRRNVLEEQLREHAREWSRLTIAEALLEKTRHKFEQERQPSVILYAQDFFSDVTGQRYDRLYAPIGEQTITVTDSTGASKQPGEMSRGTREQLYLALRFGLIREFGEHAERLPVVVDEALVNFDPERARLAAESFGQLAETNQVLVFTCHPTTAEMFADAARAQVVDISR